MQAREYMRLNFTIAGAMALALTLAAIFVATLSLGAGAVPAISAPAPAPATEPQSGEESIAALMQGQPYDGPAVATPRGLDGKPDFTGVWRPVRENGKPGGNLGKDYPGFRLPYTEAGKRALLYSQNHTVDPEALCRRGCTALPDPQCGSASTAGRACRTRCTAAGTPGSPCPDCRRACPSRVPVARRR